LSDALKTRENARFLCAGGSTPGPVYSALSCMPLDWGRVAIGLTDERWVSRTDPGSNHAFLERTLLQNEAQAATFYPMVTDANLPHTAEASQIDLLYKSHLLPADLMILGMGTDGHTLSWFAEADELSEALSPQASQMVTSIAAPQTDITGIYTSRQTLTSPAIAAARHILLLLTGDKKRTVFENSTPDTPIRHMIAAAGDRLTTYWAP